MPLQPPEQAPYLVLLGGPGTRPVGTLCQPSIDIPNVNT